MRFIASHSGHRTSDSGIRNSEFGLINLLHLPTRPSRYPMRGSVGGQHEGTRRVPADLFLLTSNLNSADSRRGVVCHTGGCCTAILAVAKADSRRRLHPLGRLRRCLRHYHLAPARGAGTSQNAKVKGESWRCRRLRPSRRTVIPSNREGSRPARLSDLGFCLYSSLFFSLSCSSLVTRHCFQQPPVFHQHNGKETITSLFFNNIMERLISDIFPLFVFNNIMEVTFIFPPRVFSLPGHQE